MRGKLAKVDELLESGFYIDEITSDDTLNIHLSCDETHVTIRFDKEEVAEMWPELFPSKPESPARRLVDVPEPSPYGAATVAAFLTRDDARN